MKAKLIIDIYGLTEVVLTPDTKAERLILERMAKTKTAEITKTTVGERSAYASYDTRNNLHSLTLTELRGPQVEREQ